MINQASSANKVSSMKYQSAVKKTPIKGGAAQSLVHDDELMASHN